MRRLNVRSSQLDACVEYGLFAIGSRQSIQEGEFSENIVLHQRWHCKETVRASAASVVRVPVIDQGRTFSDARGMIRPCSRRSFPS